MTRRVSRSNPSCSETAPLLSDVRSAVTPTNTRTTALSLSLGSLSAVFGMLAFNGTIRAIYEPSAGLILSVLIFSVAAVALALSVMNLRSSRGTQRQSRLGLFDAADEAIHDDQRNDPNHSEGHV